jgi:hypothetical protein
VSKDDGFVAECGAFAASALVSGRQAFADLSLGPYTVKSPLDALGDMRSWAMLQANLKPQFLEVCTDAWPALEAAGADFADGLPGCASSLAEQVRVAVGNQCRLHADGFLETCGPMLEGAAWAMLDDASKFADLPLGNTGKRIRAPLEGLNHIKSWAMLQAVLRPQFLEVCADAWGSLARTAGGVACGADLAASLRAALEERCRAAARDGAGDKAHAGTATASLESQVLAALQGQIQANLNERGATAGEL